MNCFFASNHLSSLLENTLPLLQGEELAEHLGACEHCREQYRNLQETAQILEGIPLPEPPLRIRARVRLHLRKTEKNKSWLQYFIFPPSVVLFLIILTVVLLWLGFYLKPKDRPMVLTPAAVPVAALVTPVKNLPTATPISSPVKISEVVPVATATPGVSLPTATPQVALVSKPKVKETHQEPKPAVVTLQIKVSADSLNETEGVFLKTCRGLQCQTAEGQNELIFIQSQNQRLLSFTIPPVNYLALRARLAPLGEFQESGFSEEMQEQETRMAVKIVMQAQEEPTSESEE